MEVHPEVYRWLGALHVIDPRAPAPSVTRQRYRVMLDEQTSMDFENGQVRAVVAPVLSSRPPTGRVPSNTQLSTCAGPNPARHAQRHPRPARPAPDRPLARPETRAERPRAHPDPATRPPTHLPAGPARRRPSRSHPSLPIGPGIGEPLQSRRPARHAPRPDRHLQARPIPHRANVQLEPPRSRVPPLRHHRGRRQALVVAGDRDFVSRILSRFYERTVGDLSMIIPSHSYYEEEEPVDIDNGAGTNADPSPLTSHPPRWA